MQIACLSQLFITFLCGKSDFPDSGAFYGECLSNRPSVSETYIHTRCIPEPKCQVAQVAATERPEYVYGNVFIRAHLIKRGQKTTGALICSNAFIYQKIFLLCCFCEHRTPRKPTVFHSFKSEVFGSAHKILESIYLQTFSVLAAHIQWDRSVS